MTDPDRLSAIASVLAALLVVIASNKQWWTIAIDGHMVTRRWAWRMLLIATGWLLTALVLLFVDDENTAFWIAIGGGTASMMIAWPLRRTLHRRAIARFRAAHPGLAGAPLKGGDFD